MDLSHKTIERICRIYGYLGLLQKTGVKYVTSQELADIVGVTSYSVRKDISSMEVISFNRKGYEVESLKSQLGTKLNLSKSFKVCIVGLGRLGTALLDYEAFKDEGFQIVAGFDSSINKVETIHTNVDVFPISQLEVVVKQRQIELGIIAVPPKSAQDIANKLIEGGVKGILNFSPVMINVPEKIIYHDMDFTDALRFVAARINK